jgi:hypothetical protein
MATTKKETIEVLDRQIGKHSQGIKLNEYISIEGIREAAVKLQIEIHLDTSYANQSHATIKRWDGFKWNLCAYLLHTDIKSTGPAYNQGPTPAHFATDRKRLIDIALKILA